MTAEQIRKWAGSVVIAGFRGLSAGPESRIHRQIRDLGLGGVILFDTDATTGHAERNIASASQLRRLTGQLREAAGQNLLIAVDQEGGRVARLSPRCGYPTYPSHAEMGEHFEPAETQLVASRMASALADAGVNVNLAPVVDLNLGPNPVLSDIGRSFSHDAGSVTQHARAFIRGHREHRVAAALKHFPGHGSALADTHQRPVDITETCDPRELEPYRRLIAEGNVDMVMTGHLLHRGYDAQHPASLSERMIRGLLREDLAFDGVVITDDLDMAAVAGQYSLQQRVALALAAGADLLLFGNNLRYSPDLPERAVEAVEAAVQTGALPPERLRQSAERAARLCARLRDRPARQEH